jgi:alpha/beta superfamily hydrolase
MRSPLREIAGPAGRLEALLEDPSNGTVTVRAAVVFAHPHPQYGGTMHTKVVYQAAKAFGRIGCAALRFNFRGAGASAGTFTGGPGEMDDFRAALDFMHQRYPNVPLWAGGMSFGAWIGMTVGAHDDRVTTLIGIAVPVTTYDLEPVARSPKAKFLIHGERDELCALKDVREFYARADEPKELVVIDAADHLFDGKVSEVADAIEDLLGDW